jgi:hypothetical protein
MSIETATAVKAGDIFYTSWGYDQTNVDFYLAIEVSKTGKTVKLRQIQAMNVADEGPHDSLIPNSTELAPNFVTDYHQRWCTNCQQRIEIGSYGANKGKLIHYNTDTPDCLDGGNQGSPTGTKAKRAKPTIYTKRVRYYDGKPVLTWTSYSNAYLWDGQPKYQTGPYSGH